MIWWQPVQAATVPMISAIVATHESERMLVLTLSALVPAVAAGLLRDVVVVPPAAAGPRDPSAEAPDLPGCRFIGSDEPLGARLKAAAAQTRSPWLMFLRAGTVPEPAWIAAAEHFIHNADAADMPRAAVFR